MDERNAWESYWQVHSSRGCVPDSPGVALVLSNCWREFARQVPRQTRVLDLGTGVGAVLNYLGRSRPDLEMVGVDYAASLPLAGNAWSVMAGIKMEQLPFADRSFGAFCSQFGIEYSDLPRTIAEIARVARKGALFQFVVHDANGPIFRQGRSRRAALLWAAEQSACFAEAERLLEDRATVPVSIPPTLRDAVEAARTTFPREPVAHEIMLALLQVVSDGARVAAPEGLQRLRQLRAQIRSELATLGALLRSAKDEKGIADLTDLLASKSAAVRKPAKLVEPRSRLAFAWHIGGRFG